jgi:hypothetical protein
MTGPWKKTWPVCEKKHDRSAKKNMTGPWKKQYLSHRSYRKLTIILCISIVMIFYCCPIIFWYFRQVHGHRSFFSLLTAFDIHTDSPEIHNAEVSLPRPNFCSKWTQTFSVDSWGPLETFLFEKNHLLHIFCSLEDVLEMCNALRHSWQTNAKWIPLFLLIPNSNFTI